MPEPSTLTRPRTTGPRRAAATVAAAATLLATGVALAPAASPTAPPTAVPRTAAAPERAAGVDPDDASPPGANDFSCRPTRRHPFPVVLVPGTFESMAKNWSTLSPVLADAGYCVFALNYGETNGVYATGPIQRSARELARFVDRVLRRTGARKVAVVGHSQGGMMPRQYMRFEGGRRTVRTLVGIVPSNHGTEGVIAPTPERTGSRTARGDSPCRACEQQQAGSRFLRRLNRGGDLVRARRGPYYTVITTRYDEVVTPYESQYLAGPARRVTNLLVQDVCPADPVEHDQAPNDPVVHALVLEALRHRNRPADPTPEVDCTAVIS